jgi:hypothetical protein
MLEFEVASNAYSNIKFVLMQVIKVYGEKRLQV